MAKVKTAVGGKSVFNMSTTHTSTFEIGQVRPSYYHHLIPGDKISVDMSMKALTAPLVYPSFAKLNFVHRAFYVPYSLISPRFEDFYNNRSVNYKGIQTSVGIPYFYNRDIIKIFIADSLKVTAPDDASDFIKYGSINPDYSLFHFSGESDTWNAKYSEVTQGAGKQVENMFVRAIHGANISFGYDTPIPTNFAFDFVYYLRASSTECFPVYCQLKPFGRFVLKCLDSLGYQLGFFFKDSRELISTSSPDLAEFNTSYNLKCNAFSLLAFMKIIYDNYIPSQYANSSVFARIFTFIQSTLFYFGPSQDLGVPGHYSDVVEQRSVLMDILQVCLLYAWQVFAGSDYFTDAWYEMDKILSSVLDNRNSINNFGNFDKSAGRGLDISVDYDGTGTRFENANDDVEELVQNASETGHKWLKGLYNLFKRSNLAGTRLGESILAIFGVKVPSAQIQKSVYLGKKVNELIIYDVTQNATTSEKKLGDFAGKGLSVLSDGQNWTFESDDFGVFLILSSVVSEGGYVQGVDRINMISDNLDFYHPELEKTGNQPIDVMELIGPPSLSHPNSSETITAPNNNYLAHNIFGFAPRYSFMKYPKSFLTGDFRVPHVGGGLFGVLNAYHGYRLLNNPNSIGDVNKQGLVQTGLVPIAQREILFDNGRQYNRVFNVTDNEQDHIFSEMNFHVKLISSMLTLQDSIDLDGFREVGSANGETLD